MYTEGAGAWPEECRVPDTNRDDGDLWQGVQGDGWRRTQRAQGHL